MRELFNSVETLMGNESVGLLIYLGGFAFVFVFIVLMLVWVGRDLS